MISYYPRELNESNLSDPHYFLHDLQIAQAFSTNGGGDGHFASLPQEYQKKLIKRRQKLEKDEILAMQKQMGIRLVIPIEEALDEIPITARE